MQAIILAAGMGKRLKELTRHQAKCMVEVNGVPMIERMMRQLERYGLNRIILVVGHGREGLKKHIESMNVQTPVEYIENSVYETTNNIYSLYLAREYLLADDTILLESDLIFEESLLDQLYFDPYPTLALVAPFKSWMDGTVVIVDQNYHITNFLTRKDFKFEDINTYYKTVNIYKFSAAFSATHYVPFLEAYSKALGNNEYYEQVLKVISLLDDHGLKALSTEQGFWYEIDDEQDLDIAESIFTDSQSRFQKMSQRFGGYWRYPELLDYCYLVNPYFPNERLMGEIKANFEQLVTCYPSGLSINNLLIAKSLGIRSDQVMAGNGAAELIPPLLDYVSGKIGLLFPSFEEYANRSADIVPYMVASEYFRYSADDIIDFYADKDIKAFVLVNPDNPSGNYIRRDDVIRLIELFCQKEILFILDESFVDFADEKDASLIHSEILDQYPGLVIIKSISKSYGVPGLRLGLMASSNMKLLDAVRQKLSIWNINSFGEYFLQIFEKYQADYQQSLQQFRTERSRMWLALTGIRQLRVLPSQANYFTIEIIDGLSSRQIAEILLNRYNILVKNLSEKRGMEGQNYIRIAIRAKAENDQLLEAFNHILR